MKIEMKVKHFLIQLKVSHAHLNAIQVWSVVYVFEEKIQLTEINSIVWPNYHDQNTSIRDDD